jgi:hypothetical protein
MTPKFILLLEKCITDGVILLHEWFYFDEKEEQA